MTIIFFLLIVSNCTNNNLTTAKDILSQYLDAVKNGNCEVMYDLTLEKFNLRKDPESYCVEFSKQREFYMDWAYRKLKYNIKNVKAINDTTTIEFTITIPDPRTISEILNSDQFSKDKSKIEILLNKLDRSYNDGKIPDSTRKLNYDFIETTTGWKISNFNTRYINY